MENMQEELKKLIIENPNLDLKIFVGENSNREVGIYSIYKLCNISSVGVEKITLYDEIVYIENKMEDCFYDILEHGQSEKKLKKEVDKAMEQQVWEYAICIFVD